MFSITHWSTNGSKRLSTSLYGTLGASEGETCRMTQARRPAYITCVQFSISEGRSGASEVTQSIHTSLIMSAWYQQRRNIHDVLVEAPVHSEDALYVSVQK